MGQRGWKRVWEIAILASYKFHFIKVHENLVQHLNNNISIALYIIFFCDSNP